MRRMTTIFEQAREGRSLWIGLFQLEAVDPDGPHCTLLFCGKDAPGDAARAAMQSIALLTSTVGGLWSRNLVSRVGGVARFRGNEAEGDPIVHLLQDVRIRSMKDQLTESMQTWGGWRPRRDDFDYTPHVTLERTARTNNYSIPPVNDLHAYEWTHVAIVCGTVIVRTPLQRLG